MMIRGKAWRAFRCSSSPLCVYIDRKLFLLYLTLPNCNRLWESECEIPMKTKIFLQQTVISVHIVCICVRESINEIYSLGVHWNMHACKRIGAHKQTHIWNWTVNSSLQFITYGNWWGSFSLSLPLWLDRESVWKKNRMRVEEDDGDEEKAQCDA